MSNLDKWKKIQADICFNHWEKNQKECEKICDD